MELQRLSQGLAHWAVCRETFSIYGMIMSSSEDAEEIGKALRGMPHTARALTRIVADTRCWLFNLEAGLETIKTRSV